MWLLSRSMLRTVGSDFRGMLILPTESQHLTDLHFAGLGSIIFKYEYGLHYWHLA